MAYTLRGRRVNYDNIASGSATGQERTKGTLTSENIGGNTGKASGELIRASVSTAATSSHDEELTISGVTVSEARGEIGNPTT